jgi:hypothetical protein
MHWLAFVLSDHPHQDPNRDFLVEDPPRRATNPAASWGAAPAPESLPRASFSSRSVKTLVKPVVLLS